LPSFLDRGTLPLDWFCAEENGMPTVTVEQIADELRGLSPMMLARVREFVRQLQAKNGSHSADDGNVELAEEGMGDFLAGLRDYEERLARGEVHWQ
jgi:hypothetical protein